VARPRNDANAVPTLQRILTAAESTFAAQGYARARLSDIALDAGITRPSLLYHFKTKEALYSAVLSENLGALMGAFEEAMNAEESYDEQFIRLIETYVAFLDSRPAFASLLLREILNEQGVMRAHVRTLLVPIVDAVEVWVSRSGRTPQGVPVRAALMHLAANALVRKAAGDLQVPLWGEDTQTVALARHLLLS
jgi:AcrR family transcriptional regulator